MEVPSIPENNSKIKNKYFKNPLNFKLWVRTNPSKSLWMPYFDLNLRDGKLLKNEFNENQGVSLF